MSFCVYVCSGLYPLYNPDWRNLNDDTGKPMGDVGSTSQIYGAQMGKNEARETCLSLRLTEEYEGENSGSPLLVITM